MFPKLDSGKILKSEFTLFYMFFIEKILIFIAWIHYSTLPTNFEMYLVFMFQYNVYVLNSKKSQSCIFECSKNLFTVWQWNIFWQPSLYMVYICVKNLSEYSTLKTCQKFRNWYVKVNNSEY